MRTILLSLTFALASCAGPVHGTVTVATPDLVYVAPGVAVIADYGESIFYVDGLYWWYLDGLWYRSTYYTGGWAYAPAPPPAIVRVGDPVRYRYYRPHDYVARRAAVPPSRIQRPVVRDHRRR
ncbi:MAG TPA: hypothetical protein VLT45_12445 [Kofleriaceae bacterium]|nr:hypothetical protein [Kofleriaceae bacterium]